MPNDCAEARRRRSVSVAHEFRIWPVVALACLVGCRGAASSERAVVPSTVPVDHVILAIDSLERGIELLRNATGLTPPKVACIPAAGRKTRYSASGRDGISS